MRRILAIGLLLVMGAPAMGRIAIAPWPVPPVEPPVCPHDPPVGYVYQWVPAVYRTVRERVWIPERVRQVEYWVETSPGVWERRWRTVVEPGRFETVTKQVMLREGYWRLARVDGPRPRPVPMPREIPARTGTVG